MRTGISTVAIGGKAGLHKGCRANTAAFSPFSGYADETNN